MIVGSGGTPQFPDSYALCELSVRPTSLPLPGTTWWAKNSTGPTARFSATAALVLHVVQRCARPSDAHRAAAILLFVEQRCDAQSLALVHARASIQTHAQRLRTGAGSRPVLGLGICRVPESSPPISESQPKKVCWKTEPLRCLLDEFLCFSLLTQRSTCACVRQQLFSTAKQHITISCFVAQHVL